MKTRVLAIALAMTACPLLPSPVRAQWQPAIPAAVGACSANPLVCAVVVTGAGWILYWRHHPPLFCTTSGCREQRMMQDPEASESSTQDYVWADDEAQARRMCERTAERHGWRLDGVRQANNWTNNAGKKRFTCTWTIFGASRR